MLPNILGIIVIIVIVCIIVSLTFWKIDEDLLGVGIIIGSLCGLIVWIVVWSVTSTTVERMSEFRTEEIIEQFVPDPSKFSKHASKINYDNESFMVSDSVSYFTAIKYYYSDIKLEYPISLILSNKDVISEKTYYISESDLNNFKKCYTR